MDYYGRGRAQGGLLDFHTAHELCSPSNRPIMTVLLYTCVQHIVYIRQQLLLLFHSRQRHYASRYASSPTKGDQFTTLSATDAHHVFLSLEKLIGFQSDTATII